MTSKLKLVVAVVIVTLLALALAGCSDEIPSAPEQAPTTARPTAEETSTGESDPTAEAQEESAAVQEAPAEADAPEPEEEAVAEEPEPADTAEDQADQAAEPAPWIPDAPLPFDPTVVRGTLTNGLTYYIKHNEEPRDRAQLSLVVRAGSVLEEEAQRGLAHLVEHMAFNGTERFAKQEIVDYIESIGSSFGADLNAGTSYDYTVYWLEFPADDPEILETAFQILSDWAFAISFEPEEVELERGVVLEEWRLYQGFGSRFQTNLYPLLFGDSRYAERDPIGLTEILETAPVEQLQAYYERWYRPDLMAIVAVGQFDMWKKSKPRSHSTSPRRPRVRHTRTAPPSPIPPRSPASTSPTTTLPSSTCSPIPKRPSRR